MRGAQPWAVRAYRLSARLIGDLSTDAAETFAVLYADERRRGRSAALRLWLRAMLDLLLAGAILTRPRLFSGLGHDLRWA